jgi:hypothetical protein
MEHGDRQRSGWRSARIAAESKRDRHAVQQARVFLRSAGQRDRKEGVFDGTRDADYSPCECPVNARSSTERHASTQQHSLFLKGR